MPVRHGKRLIKQRVGNANRCQRCTMRRVAIDAEPLPTAREHFVSNNVYGFLGGRRTLGHECC